MDGKNRHHPEDIGSLTAPKECLLYTDSAFLYQQLLPFAAQCKVNKGFNHAFGLTFGQVKKWPGNLVTAVFDIFQAGSYTINLYRFYFLI